MEVENRVMPNREQIEGFAEPGPSGPIYMVNLLKFKEHAEYPDGRDTDCDLEHRPPLGAIAHSGGCRRPQSMQITFH